MTSDYRTYSGYVTPGFLDAQQRNKTAERFARRFELMEIDIGWKVLDAGCGPASNTLDFARRVGAEGQVVGIDIDDEMLTLANQRAKDAGLKHVTHQSGDVHNLDFEEGYFDACNAIRVFLHLEDPRAALGELARVTRPGGSIVITDIDGGAFSVDSPLTDTERALAKAWSRRNRNPYIGRMLKGLFVQAGLINIQIEVTPFPIHELGVYRQLFGNEALVATAIEEGVVTRQQITEYFADLERAEKEGMFFACARTVTAKGNRP